MIILNEKLYENIKSYVLNTNENFNESFFVMTQKNALNGQEFDLYYKTFLFTPSGAIVLDSSERKYVFKKYRAKQIAKEEHMSKISIKELANNYKKHEKNLYPHRTFERELILKFAD